jgi:hypothetical protein
VAPVFRAVERASSILVNAPGSARPAAGPTASRERFALQYWRFASRWGSNPAL